MNFWHNNRYESFERGARHGDAYRGQTHADFPWQLATREQRDVSGDLWHLQVQCLELVPEQMSNEVQVTLRLVAHCQLSPEKTRALGFDPLRLELAGEESLRTLLDTEQKRCTLPLAELEKEAKRLLEDYAHVMRARYDDTQKRNIILRRFRQTRFCRFSDE